MTHTARIARTGIQCACLPSRRPIRAVNTNPAIGRTEQQRCQRLSSPLICAHRVVLVDQRRLLVAVDRDDDGQADGRLSRRRRP